MSCDDHLSLDEARYELVCYGSNVESFHLSLKAHTMWIAKSRWACIRPFNGVLGQLRCELDHYMGGF